MDFQAVTALNQPDFRTISEFRRRLLNALSGLFVRHRQLVVDGMAEGAMDERRFATGAITQPSPRR